MLNKERFWPFVWVEFIWLSLFGFLESKKRKEARYVMRAAKRYMHYKSDILSKEKLAEIQQRLDVLTAAMRTKDNELIDNKRALLEQYLDTLPQVVRTSLAENVEVIFVIFVIFLGVRAYIAQPFRIPTGSMQPSLNGIKATVLSKDTPSPNIFQSGWDMLIKGSSYVNIKADARKTARELRDASWFLFTQTKVIFDDGSEVNIPAATGEVARYFLTTKGTYNPTFNKGEDIVHARFDAGDLVIVDKASYHFRRPERGEVFVFDTRGIDGIHRRSGDQAAGAHYIKRLVGLPGDTLQVRRPSLLVNGKEAQEETIQRVIQGKPPYNPEGYSYATPEYSRIPLRQYITGPQSQFKLAVDKSRPEMNEYAAFGDNTNSSLDSRFWGPVKQYNIIGPGYFALWPFTEHWGLIP